MTIQDKQDQETTWLLEEIKKMNLINQHQRDLLNQAKTHQEKNNDIYFPLDNIDDSFDVDDDLEDLDDDDFFEDLEDKLEI